MDDLISRKAAIEAIQNLYPDMSETCIAKILDRWYKKNKQYIECEDAINKLPSVQSEKVCIANITMPEKQVLEAVEKAKSEIIQLLPSKQPERKKGKWVKLGADSFHCRLCGHTFTVIQGEDFMNCCPNCGTDMRGDGNDN